MTGRGKGVEVCLVVAFLPGGVKSQAFSFPPQLNLASSRHLIRGVSLRGLH